MEIKYHTNNHSKYLIKLHFVIAVKYRKRLLVGAIKDDIMQIKLTKQSLIKYLTR